MPNRQFYFLVKCDYKIANSKLKASEVKKSIIITIIILNV